MKVSIYFFALSSLLILLPSCYSSRVYNDDDVYIVESNALPIGESLTDETSYATYKYRQRNNEISNDYFYDERNYLYTNSCYNNFYGNNSFGCSYYAYNIYNCNYIGYYGFNNSRPFFDYGFGLAFSNYYYDPFLGIYIYNLNVGYPYGYHGGFYGGYYPYYADYYPNYNHYGNYSGGFGSGNFNQTYQSNLHRGQRGSLSGISNTSGRSNPNTLKMSSAGPIPNTKPLQTQTRIKKSNNPIGSDVKNNVGINNSKIDRNSNTTIPQYRPTDIRINQPARNPQNQPSRNPINSRPIDQQRGRPINNGGFDQRRNIPSREIQNPGRKTEQRPTQKTRRN